MGGISANDDPSAEPWPGQQHRLDRAVDDVGACIERGAGRGDVVAILRQALSEQIRVVLAFEHRTGCFGADVEDIHDIRAQRHGAGLAADALEELHSLDIAGPRHLHAPTAITGGARHECCAHKKESGGRTNAVEPREQIESVAPTIGKIHGHSVVVFANFGNGKPKAHLDAGPLSSRQQNLVQTQPRQRADRRDAIVAKQELVMDNQLPVRVEDAHVVIDETGGQYFWQNAERIIDAQRICRLAEPDARQIERRAALDEDDCYAAPGQGRRCRQSANAASHHQNTSNFAHVDGADVTPL